MDAILAVLEKAGRYLLTIRITDLLDIAIMAYLVYKLLSLVKSTRAANILKVWRSFWRRCGSPRCWSCGR